VIDGVKAKLQEVQHSMPPGVTIVPTYDRSWLIGESINTLRHTLIEESIVVLIVIIIFLFHFRSALIPILALPVAVLASFIPMYYLDVTSNIMSLGGLALAIGVLVDASIVMVENAYRHVSEGGAPIDESSSDGVASVAEPRSVARLVRGSHNDLCWLVVCGTVRGSATDATPSLDDSSMGAPPSDTCR